MGKGVVSVFQRRISGARWAAGGQTKSSVQQAEPPVADAKGDQRGMGQHSGVWSSAVSAVVWNLPQLYLENGVHPPFWVFSINVLAPLMPSGECTQEPMGGTRLLCLTPLLASVEFPQEPICGWSLSADLSVLVSCVGILGVSPCQTCLF